MVCNKILDFAQLFLDQLVECVTGNKKSEYVSYPYWIGLILARNEDGYNFSHGIIIPSPALSSKIISVAPFDGDNHITQRMENWVANAYIVESYDSEEEDDENDDEDNEEGIDDEEDANDEEDIEDEED